MTATLDPASTAGARALERLATELIGWLTTVEPGRPAAELADLVPVGRRRGPHLLRQAGAAERERRRDRPLVAFNLNTDAVGGDVVTMEGEARIDPATPPAHENPAYAPSTRRLLDEYGWTAEYFAGDYPVAILRPADALARRVSIAQARPRRDGGRDGGRPARRSPAAGRSGGGSSPAPSVDTTRRCSCRPTPPRSERGPCTRR